MRVLPSLTIVAGLVLACTHRVPNQVNGPTPPPRLPNGTMSADEASRQNATSLEQMLVGRISGVSVSPAPGGGIVVRMGGPTSFYSGQEPLIVVDGNPVAASGGTLTWLDPHDVEYIRALKDPSETAIYGVRGANGVILIKTKGAH
jgi:TonB-dependent SusC/RagA subfamily outer membrane receptor